MSLEPVSVTVFVPWKPVSPNQLLHKHWTVSAKNSKMANAEWRSALALSFFQDEKWTQIISRVRSSQPEMPLPHHLASTTETSASHGNTDGQKPAGNRGCS